MVRIASISCSKAHKTGGDARIYFHNVWPGSCRTGIVAISVQKMHKTLSFARISFLDCWGCVGIEAIAGCKVHHTSGLVRREDEEENEELEQEQEQEQEQDEAGEEEAEK